VLGKPVRAAASIPPEGRHERREGEAERARPVEAGKNGAEVGVRREAREEESPKAPPAS
jgi:hypothetical protein